MYRLDIFDETMFATPIFAMSLHLSHTQTTAKELLKARIKQDCETANIQNEQSYQTKQTQLLAQYEQKLGELTEHEKRLNGEKLPKSFTNPVPKTQLRDWQEEFDKAVKSFLNNGFILIIDDKQITDLDAPLHIKSDDTSKLTFLQLIPLQGG
ncbi:hypothetical protein [Moraxella oblonga]|uniref:hypothetical protein n=1 Tax=Moraxella oblonga TaxID=200413 RepID=UPI00082B4020|nr:hypothetical protein [Moraxella oblonga]